MSRLLDMLQRSQPVPIQPADSGLLCDCKQEPKRFKIDKNIAQLPLAEVNESAECRMVASMNGDVGGPTCRASLSADTAPTAMSPRRKTCNPAILHYNNCEPQQRGHYEHGTVEFGLQD